jgi:hypothetical protein
LIKFDCNEFAALSSFEQLLSRIISPLSNKTELLVGRVVPGLELCQGVIVGADTLHQRYAEICIASTLWATSMGKNIIRSQLIFVDARANTD